MLTPPLITAVVPIPTEPFTSNVYAGAVVPIPTLPEVNTAEFVPFPTTWSFAAGAVVPMPMFVPV